MAHGSLSKLYYSIGEVSSITGVKPHILRFWENEFAVLRPLRLQSGKDRRYRERDLRIIQIIKRLVYEERYTIEGARKKMEDREFVGQALKGASVSASCQEDVRADVAGLWEVVRGL